jgi:glycosyltransferase involved in cell wall biosynthesis
MRLEVDLRLDAGPNTQGAGSYVLDLDTIAGAIRAPARLRILLRDRRYDELAIRTGELPLSGRQAIVLVALTIARTRTFVRDGRRSGRTVFAAGAVATAAAALTIELAWTVVLAPKILFDSRRRYRLPVTTPTARSVLYLRVEPTMRWHGSQVGGAATHTTGVVNGLIDGGADVRVVASERPVGTERAAFVRVRPRRVLDLVQGVGYAGYARAIARVASGYGADLVYERYQYGSSAGLRVARRLRVPLVLEFNGPEIWVQRHWRGGRMVIGGLLERLERRNLRDASLVVVVSEPLRRHVLDQGVPPGRVLVNPNGVDVDQLAPYRRLSPREWRQRLAVPDVPTVGFIGTFGRWHGVELLPSLIAAVPDSQWILIGGGGLFEQVRAEIQQRGLSDRVRLTGVIEHDNALETLACSDVCISPHIPNPDGSAFFGSPTKLFEYMGLARPIVASDLGQIADVIEDGTTGLLCPPGDVEAAAIAVRRLLGDSELRARLGQAALERAAASYSWSAHARRIVDAITGSPG